MKKSAKKKKTTTTDKSGPNETTLPQEGGSRGGKRNGLMGGKGPRKGGERKRPIEKLQGGKEGGGVDLSVRIHHRGEGKLKRDGQKD